MTMIVELNAPFVPWNSNISPTAAAVQFDKDLRVWHNDVLNLGQGREIDEPSGSIFPKGYSGTHGTAYNSDVGGSEALRKTAANYVNFFLGIPADQSNTFVLQQNGRNGLGIALSFASIQNTQANGVGLPGDRWPMYNDIVHKIRFARVKEYRSPTGDKLGASLVQLLESQELFAFTTNTPHNPTGKNYSTDYMRALGKKLDEVNSKAEEGNKILHCLDIPYFYALKPTQESFPSISDSTIEEHLGHENFQPYFDGGFQHVTKMDASTPWIAVVSESKALMAKPGLSIVVTHPKIAEKIKRELSSSVGISYDPAFFSEVQKCFAPNLFATHAKHYGTLREKYVQNRKTLEAGFTQQIVDGDPGMTALTIMKGVIGKEVIYKTSSGENFSVVIDSSAKLAEYIGNTERVVTVPNGTDKDGNPKIRFALSQHPDNFAIATKRVVQTYKNLLRANYN